MNFKPEKRSIEKGEKNDQHIDSLIDSNPSLKLVSININGEVLMVIEDKDLNLQDFNLLKTILKQQKKVDIGPVFGNCYFIAAESVMDGT